MGTYEPGKEVGIDIINEKEIHIINYDTGEKIAEHKLSHLRGQNRRFKQSKLNSDKNLSSFNFDFQKSITKKEINQLLDFEWLEQAFNLIFLGPPGVGKTHLACHYCKGLFCLV